MVLNVFVENIGIPFPTEASYVLAAVQIRQGQSFILMLALLTGGHLAGSWVAYRLGWWGKGWLTDRLSHKSSFIKASDFINHWYDRYGSITVFALRFLGHVRPWASLVAGFAHIKWQPFLAWTFAGTLLFNIIVLEFTLYFVNWWTRFGPLFKYVSIVLFLISFSLIFWAGRYWKNRPDNT